jgi:hypothetical protein
MKESPEELERKAAKYRRLARDVGDKLTADRILTLAEELEQQAHKPKLEKSKAASPRKRNGPSGGAEAA